MEQLTAWSGRAYTWSLITYADFVSIDRLLSETQHFAYCIHDKDCDENGEQVTPHVHILCTFEKNVSLNWIKEKMNSTQNTLGECRRRCGNKWTTLNVQGLYEYLIHEGFPEKYQYSPEDRKVDNTEYWKKYERRLRESSDEFLIDLLADYINERELMLTMAKKYGRDFLKNYERYIAFRNKLGYGYTESRERLSDYEDLCYKANFEEL